MYIHNKDDLASLKQLSYVSKHFKTIKRCSKFQNYHYYPNKSLKEFYSIVQIVSSNPGVLRQKKWPYSAREDVFLLFLSEEVSSRQHLNANTKWPALQIEKIMYRSFAISETQCSLFVFKDGIKLFMYFDGKAVLE